MDITDHYEDLTDEECVSMCMNCVARGVDIPAAVRRRVQQLGIWKLIVGAADGYRFDKS